MLSSTSNAKVKRVVGLVNKAKNRRDEGVFVIEGIKMLLEACPKDITEVYITEECLNKNNDALRNLHIEYEVVSDDVMKKMSDTMTPQGVLALIKMPSYEIKDIMEEENPLLLVLEDISDPGNLGTIFRTAEGAGVTGIIMSKNTVDIYNPKTIRSTMGSIYRVPFVIVEDLVEHIICLKECGVAVFASHLESKKNYYGINFNEPTAVIIGNEARGITDEVAGEATRLIRIPMQGELESLNASIAAAVIMYEAARQRSIDTIIRSDIK